jgi:hypothetical protein
MPRYSRGDKKKPSSPEVRASESARKAAARQGRAPDADIPASVIEESTTNAARRAVEEETEERDVATAVRANAGEAATVAAIAEGRERKKAAALAARTAREDVERAARGAAATGSAAQAAVLASPVRKKAKTAASTAAAGGAPASSSDAAPHASPRRRRGKAKRVTPAGPEPAPGAPASRAASPTPELPSPAPAGSPARAPSAKRHASAQLVLPTGAVLPAGAVSPSWLGSTNRALSLVADADAGVIFTEVTRAPERGLYADLREGLAYSEKGLDEDLHDAGQGTALAPPTRVARETRVTVVVGAANSAGRGPIGVRAATGEGGAVAAQTGTPPTRRCPPVRDRPRAAVFRVVRRATPRVRGGSASLRPT